MVDHQVVNMEFADKSTASFTMSCFNYNGRKSNIMGTKGEMFLDFEGDEIRIFHFEGRWWETIHTNGRVDGTLVGGHGGGDPGIVNALYDYMTGAKPQTRSARSAFPAKTPVWYSRPSVPA